MDCSARHDGSGAGLIHASIVKGLLPTGKSAAMPSLWSRQLLPLRSISSIAEKRSASSFGNGGRGGGDGGGGDGENRRVRCVGGKGEFEREATLPRHDCTQRALPVHVVEA